MNIDTGEKACDSIKATWRACSFPACVWRLPKGISMRIGILLIAALVTATHVAQAKTFELLYTGNRLTRTPDNRAIKHAKKILITVSSDRPFPANTCFDVPFREVTSMTDGVDTLQTLAAAGYTEYPGNYTFNLCSDASGRHILGWTVEIPFLAPAQFGDDQNGYAVETFSSPPEGFYDQIFFEIFKKANKPISYDDSNTVAPGSWEFRVSGR
jgi:hypothetical protein